MVAASLSSSRRAVENSGGSPTVPPRGRGAVETSPRLAEFISAIFKSLDDESVVDPTPRARRKLEARPPVTHHKKFRAKEVDSFMVTLDKASCDVAAGRRC